MKKILFVSRHLTYKGGVTNYVKTLMSLLPEDEFGKEHFPQSLPPSFPNFARIMIPTYYIWQKIKFSKFLKKNPTDVVHINSTMGWLPIYRDILFARASKKIGIPVLFFVHGWRWPFYKTLKEHFSIRRLVVNNLNNMDIIFVLSTDFKKALSNIGVYENKIVTTTTMVDTKKYSQKKKSFCSPYKILFCSNMLRVKGVYELLKAANILLNKQNDIEFIFVGKGPELKNLKEKTNQLSMTDNVQFTGYVSEKEKIKLFKEAHIFVFPTYHGEGFPTVVLEAMAAGLPIVTTKNAALKHAFKDCINGYLLSSMPAEPEEIADKIMKLVSNPGLMKRISRNNLKEAKDKYDVSVVTDTVFQAYRDLYKKT